MSQLKVVGQNVKKKDVKEKVLGTAIFAADIKMDGMLYGKTLRSKVPHGIVKKINVSQALELPGVHAVLTEQDIPGVNKAGIIVKDEPVLVGIGQRIRKIGDPLAIVAAETEEIAEAALDLIEVEVEELPAVFSPLDAMKDDAPKLYEKGNIMAVRRIVKGDVAEAFKNCDVIVEQDYTTSMVEHAYIETEAGVAKMEGDVVNVWVCTQNPHYDRKDVAYNLNIGLNQARIIQTTTGGGFGGKLDVTVHVHVALLAKATKRPVKMVYSRRESISNTVKRHPFIMKYKTGCDKDGKLIAWQTEIIGDTGAYASYGPGTLTRAAVHATGPYEIPNVKVEAYTVYTNNPQAGAMRGFGVPQVAFAHESQMNLLAEKLGISPLEIRMKNAFIPGSITATGSKLEHSVGLKSTMESAKQAAEKVLGDKF